MGGDEKVHVAKRGVIKMFTFGYLGGEGQNSEKKWLRGLCMPPYFGHIHICKKYSDHNEWFNFILGACKFPTISLKFLEI